jgi:hypothetical protein
MLHLDRQTVADGVGVEDEVEELKQKLGDVELAFHSQEPKPYTLNPLAFRTREPKPEPLNLLAVDSQIAKMHLQQP